MKFLIITNHSYMLWQFRRELIVALMQYGEVVISTPFVGHEGDLRELGCNCINTKLQRRSINPIADFSLFLNYKKMIKSVKPDMVITYSIKPNVYAGFACRLMKVPYCVNVQGLGTAFQNRLIAPIATLLYRISVKSAKTVFFENEDNANEFVRRKILPDSQLKVLRGAGVNLDYFELKDYPSEKEGIHFLYLGRIMKEKGVDELFKAAKRMKDKYGTRVIFDFVGFFEDEYKEIIDDLVDKGIIAFHGFQTNPKPYYAMSHCVVLPSYHEGMSNVLLEGAATGRALICSDIPGCKDIVDDGINGFLCVPKNSESLYECMEKYLGLSEEKRIKMSAAGREKVEREFSKQFVVKETLSSILND